MHEPTDIELRIANLRERLTNEARLADLRERLRYHQHTASLIEADIAELIAGADETDAGQARAS